LKKAVLILVIVSILIPELAQAQCAMCRAVLESGDEQTAAKGINDGILYLMAIPYILVGGLGYFIFRSFRKKST